MSVQSSSVPPFSYEKGCFKSQHKFFGQEIFQNDAEIEQKWVKPERID